MIEAPVAGLRRLTRIALVLLGLGVLFVALGYFVLPAILRTQVERIAGETLHRRLAVEAVELRPFALALVLRNVRLFEADGRTVFASLDAFEVRVSPASLVQRAPVIRELHLVRPYVHWMRTGPNQYSTDDILAALTGPAPTGAPAANPPAPGPARFAVHNIRIEDGRFDFDDRVHDVHHRVDAFSLGIPFISTLPSDEEIFVQPALSAVIDGAPLRINGSATPFAPDRQAQLRIDIDDLDLARYVDYLPADVPLRLPSGHLDLRVQARIEVPHGGVPAVNVSGKAALRGLELTAPGGKPLLKLAQIDLAVASAGLPAGHLDASLTINRKGRLAVAGEVAWFPMRADVTLALADLDLLPLQPLFADRVNLRVTQAVLGAKGRLRIAREPGAALQGGFQGEVALARVASVDAVNAADFVNWDALQVRGLDLQLAPLAVHIDEIALRKFFARVIVSPEGRLNLQDVLRGSSDAQRSLTDSAPARADPTALAAPVVTAAAAGAASPPISVGRILVAGGHVRFTDNFIRPRYSAELVDLAGSVTGLSSAPDSAAVVDLRGKVNDAPLLIGGRINPLRRDLSLDVKASVHDMELAPLSPYSAKYAGYRIERGKMSFDVAYQLENRQLKAGNRLVLDQLRFGEKVDSATATTLPVQFAIALLKDRNGVIDIDLPVGGSLDDPDFSVAGVIGRVLINLITKAVTAPFALLGGIFGGGSEELAWLDFPAGSASLTPAVEAKLKSVAGALVERPGLKLDITGGADPLVDREALRGVRVDAAVRRLMRQDLAARGVLADGTDAAVAPEEYAGLLARLYAAGTGAVPAKGGAPDASQGAAPTAVALSREALEQALRARQEIADDDLRALGDRRAQAAKAWLMTIGMIPEERLALVAAKIAARPAAPGEAPAAVAPAGRVEFALH